MKIAITLLNMLCYTYTNKKCFAFCCFTISDYCKVIYFYK